MMVFDNFMVITYGQYSHPEIIPQLLHFVSFHWFIDDCEGNVVCVYLSGTWFNIQNFRGGVNVILKG